VTFYLLLTDLVLIMEINIILHLTLGMVVAIFFTFTSSNFSSLLQITNVEIVAVVNDAVGTLMSTAHSDRQCEIGLILGKRHEIRLFLVRDRQREIGLILGKRQCKIGFILGKVRDR